MASIHAESALLADGWATRVRLAIEHGQIVSIDVGVDPAPGDEPVSVLVPGMPNVHSHAFQRGMAGLAEVRGPADDNFWSWRQQMYRFALSMTPDQMQAIAAQLYVEMLEAGFCRVGEFHYLHHDRDGRPYGNIAEMAGRIAAAAGETGIGLTLLPVFYAHSTFGGAAPGRGQRRFICDLDGFGKIVDRCRDAVRHLPDGIVGIAPHSLRAVTPEELKAVIAMLPAGPIHIHAAEQVKEVDDCIAWSGARPVRWLLDHAAIDSRWCLIHATHLDEGEIAGLARSAAIAGLCPITEANLGDGIFPAVEFLARGGRFGIGTDSNIQIGVGAELRQLEYGQRLAHKARNLIARPQGSTGRALFDHALAGGGAALHAQTGMAAGNPANFISLATDDVPHQSQDTLLDSLIFTAAVRPRHVWVNGRPLVRDGRHVERDNIQKRFLIAMHQLL